jgi:hypothetical protein
MVLSESKAGKQGRGGNPREGGRQRPFLTCNRQKEEEKSKKLDKTKLR